MRVTKKLKFRPAQLRLHYRPPANAPVVDDALSSYEVFRSVWDRSLLSVQEQFYVLYLNHANELVSWRCLHTGTSTNMTIDIKLLLATALGCLAHNIVVAHNHPSGKLWPSKADLRLNENIRRRCYEHDIRLFDHLIISSTGYASFLEEGWMRDPVAEARLALKA
jgi:DNA repair protein RadC